MIWNYLVTSPYSKYKETSVIYGTAGKFQLPYLPEAAGCPEEAARTGAEGVAGLSELWCGSGYLLYSIPITSYFFFHSTNIDAVTCSVPLKEDLKKKLVCVVNIFKLMRVQWCTIQNNVKCHCFDEINILNSSSIYLLVTYRQVLIFPILPTVYCV